MKQLLLVMLLVSGGAIAQTSVTGGTQNNIGGDGSQVGAALNTQTYAHSSHNLTDSNNNSGNTTITGGQTGAGGSIIHQAPTPTNTTTTIRQAPNIVTPNLTSSGLDTCLGSSSGGISLLGFGATAGTTHADQNCVMMKQVKLLGELGLKDAAVARLLQEPNLREALLTAYPAFARLLPQEKRSTNGINSGSFKFIDEQEPK